MQTQITCPRCQTPFVAEIHQVIDVGRNPQLKELLLSGQLNVAVCPNCGAGGQMATPILYHDPEHELFMVHVPQELNMNQMEREELIGKLTRQVVDNLPPEQRRGYLFQPQMILNMQTFYEKVLETEGVTKEMIERQRDQTELLNSLARADKERRDQLIAERGDEIDETFFTMLQSYIDAAAQTQNEAQLTALTNLRAKLMTETEAGRRIEKQQIALHALNRDVKKQEGLTPDLLLKHMLKNLDDEKVIAALANTGQAALTYEFFSKLSDEIEKREKANDPTTAQLKELRDELLKMQEQLREASQKVISEAQQLLNEILQSSDPKAMIKTNMNKIDDVFMYVLSANIAQADQQGNTERAQALSDVQSTIVKALESQYPPEIIFLNKLLEADSPMEQQRLLDENAELVSPQLIQMLEAVEQQLQQTGQRNGDNGRIASVKQMIRARLGDR